jgi:hypothetical protein
VYLASITRCQTPGCQKVAFPSWYSARLETLRAASDAQVYLEEYECKSTPGVWHVTSMDKKLVRIEIQTVRRENLLRQRTHLQKVTAKKEINDKPFNKDQLKALTALLTSTIKRKKPWLYHQRHRKRGPNRFKRFDGRTRDMRIDRPALKGAAMAQMLAWANGGTYCWADFSPRTPRDADAIRRRNRARERARVRRDIFDDLSYSIFPDTDPLELTDAQSDAEDENFENEKSVRFSGCIYTIESKWYTEE